MLKPHRLATSKLWSALSAPLTNNTVYALDDPPTTFASEALDQSAISPLESQASPTPQ